MKVLILNKKKDDPDQRLRAGSYGRRTNQQGMAVITALLLVFLAATIATDLFTRAASFLLRSTVSSHYSQALSNSLAGVDLAKIILTDDNQLFDSLDETWSNPIPRTPVEGGYLQGSITDETGKANLNNLFDSKSDETNESTHILNLLFFSPLPIEVTERITTLITHRIKEKKKFIAIDELMEAEGMTSAYLDELKKTVTVLPERTSINVNTANKEVLSLALDLPDSILDSILARQKTSPWKTKPDFRAFLPAGTNLVEGMFSVKSDFFAVKIISEHGNAKAKIKALIQRIDGEAIVQRVRLD